MSLVRMREWMHGKLHIFMMGLALVFAVGWIGMSLGGGRNAGPNTEDQTGVLATVNGEKIERQDFETRVASQMKQTEQQRSVSAFEESQLRGQIFESMIDRALRMQAAKKEGVRVSRGEIRKKTDEFVDTQINQLRGRMLTGKDKSDKALDAELHKNGMALSQLKDQLRTGMDPEAVREQLAMEKLLKKLQDKVDASDQAVRASYDEVRFSQITVDGQKRSMDQAEQRIKEISDKLKSGGDFAAIAKQYSEDPYKSKGGDRGYFSRRSYIEADLADKVFSMKPGDISDPVKLSQGYMIVKMEEKRSALPADYSDPKKQKEYRDAYVGQQQYTLQSQFTFEMQKGAKIDVRNHEMKAYMAAKQMSNMMGPDGGATQVKAKALEAVKELDAAIGQSNGDPQAMARIYSQLSYFYQFLQKPGLFASSKEDSVKYLAEEKKALDNALQYAESTDLRTMMADINIQEGQYAKALENLQFVSDIAYDDPTAHKELMRRYAQLKKHDPKKIATLIATEQKWLADYDKQQAAMKKQQQGQMTQPFKVDPNAKTKPGG